MWQSKPTNSFKSAPKPVGRQNFLKIASSLIQYNIAQWDRSHWNYVLMDPTTLIIFSSFEPTRQWQPDNHANPGQLKEATQQQTGSRIEPTSTFNCQKSLLLARSI